MKYSITFGIICFFSPVLSFVFEHDYAEAICIGGFESKNCFISYVNIKDEKYIVKQKKRFKHQLAVVREALAAYIAQDLDIAPLILVISSDRDIAGKINAMWPATLQEIAPGTMLRSLVNSKYYALSLKQICDNHESLAEKGLTEKIINHMSWHWQLAIMVALDLFIANGDRHCGNIFYDHKTDTFTAIDMDTTFNCDLCLLAYNNLEIMLRDGKKFSKAEIRALKSMRDTLEFLAQKYKSDDLIAKMYEFARQAGLIRGDKFCSNFAQHKLLLFELTITSTGISVYQLIALLDTIIKNH
jgi:hypothetical protein